MTVACADCQTENRDGAKFCRGCGRRLVALASAGSAQAAEPWPPTQRLPLPASVAPAGLFAPEEAGVAPAMPRPSPARPAKPAAAASRTSSVPTSSVARPAPRKARGKPARHISLVWTCASIVLAIGIAILAAGAWYIAKKQAAETPLPPTIVATPPLRIEPPAVAPVIPPAQPAPPPVSAAPPAAAAETVPAAAPPPRIAEAAAPKPKKSPPSAAPASLSPPAPAVVAPTPLAAPAPTPEPAAPPDPQSACQGLGFFARAQCMVTQCAKADYKAHPACEAVRRQQQIDEEKRNPSLLN